MITRRNSSNENNAKGNERETEIVTESAIGTEGNLAGALQHQVLAGPLVGERVKRDVESSGLGKILVSTRRVPQTRMLVGVP